MSADIDAGVCGRVNDSGEFRQGDRLRQSCSVRLGSRVGLGGCLGVDLERCFRLGCGQDVLHGLGVVDDLGGDIDPGSWLKHRRGVNLCLCNRLGSGQDIRLRCKMGDSCRDSHGLVVSGARLRKNLWTAQMITYLDDCLGHDIVHRFGHGVGVMIASLVCFTV